jgi:hypothetical protein
MVEPALAPGSVGLALTNNHGCDYMVEAKCSLSRAKPRDYRPMLRTLARLYAKQEAIERIRHAGRKITDYRAHEIMGMADDLLLAEPQPFIQKAMRVIAEEIKRKEKPPLSAVA